MSTPQPANSLDLSVAVNKLECRYTLAAHNPQTLTRAVQYTLEDLMFSQVGCWIPYEVRLQLPLALANHDTTQYLTRILGPWLSARGYAWLALAGSGPDTTLLIRCLPAKGA